MDRVRRVLAAVQLACAVLPLLFLALALRNAAGAGFTPDAHDYGRQRFKPEEEVHKVVQDWVRLQRDAAGKTVAIWGLAAEPGGHPSATSAGVLLARQLAEKGAAVRVHDPRGAATALLPATVQVAADPYAAAQGAAALILACEEPEYVAPDFARLKSVLAQPLLLDCYGGWNSGAAETAGLVYWQYGQPAFPAWLDPEFRDTVASLAAQTDPTDGILLMPRAPLATYAPRSRWFLHLNYFLYPRRLYLPYPTEASGTMVQYWDWVNRLRAEGPPQGPVWQGGALAEALAQTGARWQLRYLPNSDFRRNDWRLLPAHEEPQ